MDSSHGYPLFEVRTEHRDKLAPCLNESGIDSLLSVPRPLQAHFREFGFKRGDFPIAEEIAQTALSPPIEIQLKDFFMKGRIYHIGLPKTGTTSIQKVTQDLDFYLGVRQPRAESRQTKVFKELTKYLRGFVDAPPVMPETFFYSEEMILVNSTDRMAESNVARLLSILRPQDMIIITTRELRSLRTSAYYEFYRFFKDMPLKEVREHPLMLPFCGHFIETLFRDHWDRVHFSKLEDFHSVLSEKLGFDLTTALQSTRANQRKVGSTEVRVEVNAPAFPKHLHFLDALLNPITRHVLKKIPQNFVKNKTKPTFIEIARLNEREITILCEGASEFSTQRFTA